VSGGLNNSARGRSLNVSGGSNSGEARRHQHRLRVNDAVATSPKRRSTSPRGTHRSGLSRSPLPRAVSSRSRSRSRRPSGTARGRRSSQPAIALELVGANVAVNVAVTQHSPPAASHLDSLSSTSTTPAPLAAHDGSDADARLSDDDVGTRPAKWRSRHRSSRHSLRGSPARHVTADIATPSLATPPIRRSSTRTSAEPAPSIAVRSTLGRPRERRKEPTSTTNATTTTIIQDQRRGSSSDIDESEIDVCIDCLLS
jgi:hypothetical protein